MFKLILIRLIKWQMERNNLKTLQKRGGTQMDSLIRKFRSWARTIINLRQWAGLRRVQPPILFRCMLLLLILSLGVCLFAVPVARADDNFFMDKVGIGTTTPLEDLHIIGNSIVSGIGSFGSLSIGMTDPGIYALYVNGDTYLGGITVTDGILSFGGDLDMKGNDITNADNIAIGKSVPTVALDVTGAAKFDGAVTINDSSADKDFRIESDDAEYMFNIDGNLNTIGIRTQASGITTRYGMRYPTVHIDSTDNAGYSIFAERKIAGPMDAPSLNFGNQSVGGATVAVNDMLGNLYWWGWDGNDYTMAAIIGVDVDADCGNDDMPGRIEFRVTPDGGYTPATQMVIKNNGNVRIFNNLKVGDDTVPTVALDVTGQGIIDVTNAEALVIRKASDGGDVFIVDTSADKIWLKDDISLRFGSNAGLQDFGMWCDGTDLLIQGTNSTKGDITISNITNFTMTSVDGSGGAYTYTAGSGSGVGEMGGAISHIGGIGGTHYIPGNLGGKGGNAVLTGGRGGSHITVGDGGDGGDIVLDGGDKGSGSGGGVAGAVGNVLLASTRGHVKIPIDYDFGNLGGRLYFGAADDGFIAHGGSNFHVESLTGELLLMSVAGSATVVNERGEDQDFRVESDGNTHAIFVDGGNDWIGIMNNAPAVALDVIGEIKATKNQNGTTEIEIVNSTDGASSTAGAKFTSNGGNFALFATPPSYGTADWADGAVFVASGLSNGLILAGNPVRMQAAATVDGLSVTTAGTIINDDSSASYDFRVETDTEDYAIFADSGNDKIGIFNSAPTVALDVIGDLKVSGVISPSIVYAKVIANDMFLATGDGKAFFTITEDQNGMILSDIDATVYTVSSSGTPTIQIHNLVTGSDVLSSLIVVNANERNTYTADNPPVINKDNDDVSTGDIYRIDVDVAGTGTKGLDIFLTFKTP